jgi:hypothetical protein
MHRQLVSDAVVGTVVAHGKEHWGAFKPAIFFTLKDLEATLSQNVLGVVFIDQGGEEDDYGLLAIPAAYTPKEIQILGPRWAAFVAEILGKKHTLTENLVRLAWLASHHVPKQRDSLLYEHVKNAHEEMEKLLGADTATAVLLGTREPKVGHAENTIAH